MGAVVNKKKQSKNAAKKVATKQAARKKKANFLRPPHVASAQTLVSPPTLQHSAHPSTPKTVKKAVADKKAPATKQHAKQEGKKKAEQPPREEDDYDKDDIDSNSDDLDFFAAQAKPPPVSGA